VSRTSGETLSFLRPSFVCRHGNSYLIWFGDTDIHTQLCLATRTFTLSLKIKQSCKQDFKQIKFWLVISHLPRSKNRETIEAKASARLEPERSLAKPTNQKSIIGWLRIARLQLELHIAKPYSPHNTYTFATRIARCIVVIKIICLQIICHSSIVQTFLAKLSASKLKLINAQLPSLEGEASAERLIKFYRVFELNSRNCRPLKEEHSRKGHSPSYCFQDLFA